MDVRMLTTDVEVEEPEALPGMSNAGVAFDSEFEVTHLVYTYNGIEDSGDFYVNGAHQNTTPVRGTLGNWEPGYMLAVGNEMNGTRPWLGDIYLLAVYCRHLSPVEVFENFQAGI